MVRLAVFPAGVLMARTLIWSDLWPSAWVPLTVLIATIAGIVYRLLSVTRHGPPRPLHMGPERRAKQGRLDGQPWQVRAIAFVGIPGAIALFLVYALVQQIEGHQTAHDQALKDHAEAATISAAADMVYRASQERQAQRLVDLMQKICVRVSKTNADQEACVGGLR